MCLVSGLLPGVLVVQIHVDQPSILIIEIYILYNLWYYLSKYQPSILLIKISTFQYYLSIYSKHPPISYPCWTDTAHFRHSFAHRVNFKQSEPKVFFYVRHFCMLTILPRMRGLLLHVHSHQSNDHITSQNSDEVM